MCENAHICRSGKTLGPMIFVPAYVNFSLLTSHYLVHLQAGPGQGTVPVAAVGCTFGPACPLAGPQLGPAGPHTAPGTGWWPAPAAAAGNQLAATLAPGNRNKRLEPCWGWGWAGMLKRRQKHQNFI